MKTSTTSTFTIHHSLCDPSKWTAADVLKLAHFVQFGDLASAAALSRLGVQLVMDERHVTVGGEAEHIGWLRGDKGEIEHDVPAETIQDLDPEHIEVTEVVPIYRGQTRYAVAFGVCDEDGNYEGTEIETFDTVEEAERFAKSFCNEPTPTPGTAGEGGQHG